MLFNTIDFVIFFFVFLLVIEIIRNRRFQHIFLLGASLFFFYYTNTYYIPILVYTIVLDFYLAKAIYKANSVQRKKILLWISLASNLGLLGFFKYTDFAIVQFNILSKYFDLNQIPLMHIIMPIGISFYTFHSLGYIIDIYRGNITPTKSLRDYAIFVAFFPQLVAGPILRAGHFLPQLREKIQQLGTGTQLRQIIIENANLKLGITIMALGFLKKMLFADNIAPMVTNVFSQLSYHDSFGIIVATIGFAIQIYCDFSGYSDIAFGAALVMGFHIPINFNKPYFASSPSEYWRRWHITLGTWVRDYLYFPLVFKNRKSNIRIFLSLLFSFFLIGLWHGSSWNFIVWGSMHGIFVAIDTVTRNKLPSLRNHRFFQTKLGNACSIFITQYLIFLSYIAFRVKDLNDLLYSIKKYIVIDVHNNPITFIKSWEFPLFLILIFVILHFISYKKENIRESIARLNFWYWCGFITSITIIIVLFYGGHPEDFIYFEF